MVYFTVVILNIVNIIFWIFILFPFKVVDITNIRIINKEIHPGDTLEFEADFCKYFESEYIAHRKLVNHYEYYLAEQRGQTKSKGCHTVTKYVPIPSYVDAGEYHVHTTLIHKIFGFRQVQSEYNTPVFQVTAKTEE